MSVNTDGLEWRRAKWSWPFKLYYVLSSFLIARLCPRLISDSHAIQAYYAKRFRARSAMIPYGAPTPIELSRERATHILGRYGLEAGKYFLQITRFEPDNLPLEAAEAFIRSGLADQGHSLVVVGFKDATPYAIRLKDLDGYSGVMVLDATYDPAVLQALREHCFCYVHGNSVGGTNPALLEAMACCPRIMAIDSPFSHEVLGPLGLYFDPSHIDECFKISLGARNQREDLHNRVNALYQWDEVALAYLRLTQGLPADYGPTESAPARRELVAQ